MNWRLVILQFHLVSAKARRCTDDEPVALSLHFHILLLLEIIRIMRFTIVPLFFRFSLSFSVARLLFRFSSPLRRPNEGVQSTGHDYDPSRRFLSW